jgi:DNA recombination protein RmuC
MIMDMILLSALVVLAVNLALTVRIAFWPKAAGEAADMNPVLDRLQAIKGDVERLDRVVREDGEQARTGADDRGRLLREEVTKSLTDTRTEMSQAMAAIRGEVVTALNKASQELRESSGELSKVQKERLDDVSVKMTSMTNALEVRLEANRSTIELRLNELRNESIEAANKLREEMQQSLARMGEGLREGAKESSETLRLSLETMLGKIDRLSETNSLALDRLRNENTEKLEQMRVTVDEKLQGTLEKRLGESFQLVSERLEAVHKGLGEMQTLATGVGDLKKVLTNVKVRGTWGETQLSNLLRQIFSPEQYHENHPTRPGSSERVEFAIRFPGQGPEDQEVLVPIDAKFPIADYERIVEAAERSDVGAVEAASKALEVRIKGAARDVRDKYINPPNTTDFAILFLPTEGLYSEVTRRPGLFDQIQNEFRVVIMGPHNLNAYLNALQMGFRTLAVQRRSSEVWEILGKVKTEFNKYGTVLDKVQQKLQEASKSVDDVAVRHRAVSRSLRVVAEPAQIQSQTILGSPSVAEISEIEEAD